MDSVKAVATTEAEARPLLAVVEQFDTTGGLLGLDEQLQGAVYQLLQRDGETIGAYALQLSEHVHGRVLWVTAAASTTREDISGHVHDIVMQQAAQIDAAQVAITTVRRGLVKKLMRLGFEVTGITLRKKCG